MRAKKPFTPTTQDLQELFNLPDPSIPQALLKEREYLREALAAVEHEITELALIGAPVKPGPFSVRVDDRGRLCIERFGSLAALANQPLEALLSIKGLGDVKILRIAAALELARRTANEIIRERERQTK